MTTKQQGLARQFARQVKDLAARNDLGGLYHQARRNLKDQVFVWGPKGELFVLPSGRRVKDFERAVGEWAGVN